ncbi:MAG: thioredoxin, partial [Halobacteriota archaeon]|nr:thioredoxin [Halobacteriota archaeon]
MAGKEKMPKSFDELINTSDRPVLVDFWAEWCGPCKMVSPVIHDIAKEYKGRLITVKVNIDERPNVASKYQVMSVPTIMIFWKGEIRMRVVGAQPYEQLRS